MIPEPEVASTPPAMTSADNAGKPGNPPSIANRAGANTPPWMVTTTGGRAESQAVSVKTVSYGLEDPVLATPNQPQPPSGMPTRVASPHPPLSGAPAALPLLHATVMLIAWHNRAASRGR